MKAIQRKPGLFLFLTLLFCISGLWADKWYRDYDLAMEAVRNGQWQTAVDHLEECLTKKDKPRVNARTVGMEFVDYLPFYYLGLANFKLGRDEEAVRALERSRADAEVFKIPQLARELDRMLRILQERGKRTPNPPELKTEEQKPVVPVEPKRDGKKEEGVPVETVKKDRFPSTDAPPAEPVMEAPGRKRPEAVETIASGESLGKLKFELKREVKKLLETRDLDGAETKLNALMELDAKDNETLRDMDKVRKARLIVRINQGIRFYFEDRPDQAEILLQALLTENGLGQTELVRIHQFLALILAERYLRGDGNSQDVLRTVRTHLQEAMAVGAVVDFDPRFFSPKLLRIVNRIMVEINEAKKAGSS